MRVLNLHERLNPGINDNAKMRVKFDCCLEHLTSKTFTHKRMVNIYFTYEINLWPFTVGKDFAFGNFYLKLLS